jgi:hypothetical protein
MVMTHLKLVPPTVTPDEAPPPVRLSIQGRHGVFYVQRDGEQAMVDTNNPHAPRCTCCPSNGPASGECEHIVLLRVCGFLAHAA